MMTAYTHQCQLGIVYLLGSFLASKGNSFVIWGQPRVGARIQIGLLRLGPKGEFSGRNPGTCCPVSQNLL